MCSRPEFDFFSIFSQNGIAFCDWKHLDFPNNDPIWSIEENESGDGKRKKPSNPQYRHKTRSKPLNRITGEDCSSSFTEIQSWQFQTQGNLWKSFFHSSPRLLHSCLTPDCSDMLETFVFELALEYGYKYVFKRMKFSQFSVRSSTGWSRVGTRDGLYVIEHNYHQSRYVGPP